MTTNADAAAPHQLQAPQMAELLTPSIPSEPLDPPPYSGTILMADFGFPSGYFVIKSVATGRLLDVAQDDVRDGAEVILWPEKETSLVEGFRKPEADNQVFFVDPTGALCSRQSGHAIDVEDGRLVLRHRRPMSYPFPNAFSHPLPQFLYSPSSKQIRLEFTSDPAYPPANELSTPSPAWRQNTYILSSVPLRKPRSLLENASTVLTNAITGPFAPLTALFGGSPPPSATAEEVGRGDIDLREDEVLEEDRGEGEEADDSPERLRKVRVLAVNGDEVVGATRTTKERRQWEVIPLRRSRAFYSR